MTEPDKKRSCIGMGWPTCSLREGSSPRNCGGSVWLIYISSETTRVINIMGALLFMAQLSAAVYLYKPDKISISTAIDGSTPRLIIVLGWVAASDVHLAKYILEYRKLYPRACILLLKSRVAIMGIPDLARKDVTPAVAAIRALFPGDTRGHGHDGCGLLIHLFSNGGSCLLSTLYDVYKTSTPGQALEPGTDTLPEHVTIIDSAPALHFDRHKIVYSIMQGVRSKMLQGLLLPFLHFLSLIWLLRLRLLAIPDEMVLWAHSHNDPVKVREVRRTYIYSDVDPIIDVQEVERHASDAEARGFLVQRELFRGSLHVAHARSEPDRYWAIVRRTWEPTTASDAMSHSPKPLKLYGTNHR